MDEGYQVTWIPSYGPEMRGGTAHCTVIIADEEIGSPLVRHPTNVVAFNNPSIEKYEPLVAPDGNLIYNVVARGAHRSPAPTSTPFRSRRARLPPSLGNAKAA